MVSSNRLAEVAAVIGEPARAAMLSALMDMRALTAAELARLAGITPQTASTHLSRLTSTGLVTAERQGRHRYHRLASASVAAMLEGMLLHASENLDAKPVQTGPRDDAMRLARTCYDHMAGRIAVAIADAMQSRGLLELSDDMAVVTQRGQRFLANHGIVDFTRDPTSRRPLCRACLDWSERRHHLAGRIGAAICSHAIENGWIRRVASTRALAVTPKGYNAFKTVFGVRLD